MESAEVFAVVLTWWPLTLPFGVLLLIRLINSFHIDERTCFRHSKTTASRLHHLGLNPGPAAVPLHEKASTDVPRKADPIELYLDLMKRAVCNLLYEDRATGFYQGHGSQPRLMRGYDIAARVMGEDIPSAAHTMIGWRRLCNLQACMEQVVRDRVAGDFVETGVLRGGAVVFMRAFLKAHDIRDRVVWAADTFVPPLPKTSNLFVTEVLFPVLKFLASVPFGPWRRFLFQQLQKVQNSFPQEQNPSEDMIDIALFLTRHMDEFNQIDDSAANTDLRSVQTTLARYGLLDDQIRWAVGFFSETLTKADLGLEKIAVLRCDGDTYQSTWDALIACYDKLQPGGFCIIDDYNSYSECSKAVEDFRKRNGITEEIIRIDRLAVYWRKNFAALAS